MKSSSKKHGLFDLGLYVYRIGRHTYWSNILFKSDDIIQEAKVDYKNGKKRWLSSQHLSKNKRQGGDDVHEVIERFIQEMEENYGKHKRKHQTSPFKLYLC